ncbi:MAG TPA: helix-turn-helix transcriptional regulator [Acidimicrobiales bacterium]|nr:helix-turn-helix transcriptional regulator [Acidimicrobiales bacterium]
MRAETLKGHLDLLLLAVVQDGPMHGYSVIEELRRRSGDALDLPEGTIYPALHRLEKAKLLRSRWSEVGGRRRRVYSLTKDGRGAVEEKRRDWQAFAQVVQQVLGPQTDPWPNPA